MGAVSMPILEIITWDDAWCEDEKTNIDEIECKPTRVQTAGWVIKENESGVLLAPEIYLEHPNYTRYPTFIPKGMIVSRMTL